jgi:hypothetical protein
MPKPDPAPNARGPADAVSPKRLGMRGSWSGADGPEPRAILGQAVPGDLTVTDQGEVWLAAVQRADDGSTTLCLGRNAARWEFEELARGVGVHPPVLHVLPDDPPGQDARLSPRAAAVAEVEDPSARVRPGEVGGPVPLPAT